MKKITKILSRVVLVFGLLLVIVYGTGNGYLVKGIWASYLHGHNSATIGDAEYFDTHLIAAPQVETPWELSPNYNKLSLSDRLTQKLESNKSVAFVVIQNDRILLEKYWDKYSDSSQSNSFSMAKSITTMLAQIAIQKGVFTGWSQSVKSLLPELKGPHAGELKLWHLSTMSSGLEWDEHYKNPFSVTAKAYYGNNVKKLMMSLPINTEPGKVYNYQSGSTQLLGLCLSAATGKPLATLASEWLWQPMGASHDATWHTDERGTELSYCCFNTNARDFARFGKMMLHHGNWHGTQILDSQFVAMATSAALAPYYGYSFWLDESHGTKIFYQRGILGQFIISIPAKNLVIVRLGKQVDLATDADPHSADFHIIVEQVLKMVD